MCPRWNQIGRLEYGLGARLADWGERISVFTVLHHFFELPKVFLGANFNHCRWWSKHSELVNGLAVTPSS
jgi:hypothetical protein